MVFPCPVLDTEVMTDWCHRLMAPEGVGRGMATALGLVHPQGTRGATGQLRPRGPWEAKKREQEELKSPARNYEGCAKLCRAGAGGGGGLRGKCLVRPLMGWGGMVPIRPTVPSLSHIL